MRHRSTVRVHGRTYTWYLNAGEWLQTAWPDGQNKKLGTTNPEYLDTTP